MDVLQIKKEIKKLLNNRVGVTVTYDVHDEIIIAVIYRDYEVYNTIYNEEEGIEEIKENIINALLELSTKAFPDIRGR